MAAGGGERLQVGLDARRRRRSRKPAMVRQRGTNGLPSPVLAGSGSAGVFSAPRGAPRSAESSIGYMTGVARYDGLAEYYDERLREFTLGRSGSRCADCSGQGRGAARSRLRQRPALSRRLLDLGWTVTGVDLSADQLESPGTDGRASSSSTPTRRRCRSQTTSFDAAAAVFTHTDMDDYAERRSRGRARARPRRQLRPPGPAPVLRRADSRSTVGEDAVPELFPGYRETAWTDDGPGFGERPAATGRNVPPAARRPPAGVRRRGARPRTLRGAAGAD